MAGRQTVFADGGYYHLFNRGVAKMPTFTSTGEYIRALKTLQYYRYSRPPMKLSKYIDITIEERLRIDSELNYKSDRLVDIICFVLMPNHFHFLLKQNVNGGISKYIGQFTNSYTRYFNTKNHRVGSLFQGVFKSVEVESEYQLRHLSRYIHLNPFVSNLVKLDQLISYPWSSLASYVNNVDDFNSKRIILSQFADNFAYKKFILDHSDYARELEVVKHMVIDAEY